MAKVLTVKAIERFKPDPDRRRHIPDGGMPGLYFIVQPSGRKSWAVWYRTSGKQTKYTIGSFPAFGLKHAREAAAMVLRRVSEGGDPALERKQTKSAAPRALFANIAEDFLIRYIRPKSRPSYAKAVERMLRQDILPAWGARPIDDIRKRDVIVLLDGITDAGRGLAANRVFATVRKLFNWSVERDLIDTSPCLGIKPPAKEVVRDRTLSDDEIRDVWTASGKLGYPFAPLIQLLILTGQRRTEVGSMTYDEIAEDDVWTIPAARTKNHREHTVPLSPQALQIIAGLPRIGASAFLFSTTGKTAVSGFSRAKSRLDALSPPKDSWVFHDLRRTVASGMARLTTALPVIEKVLNHTSGSFAGVVGVYQKYDFADEKRHAMEAWARHVEAIVEGAPDNVVPLREKETLL